MSQKTIDLYFKALCALAGVMLLVGIVGAINLEHNFGIAPFWVFQYLIFGTTFCAWVLIMIVMVDQYVKLQRFKKLLQSKRQRDSSVHY